MEKKKGKKKVQVYLDLKKEFFSEENLKKLEQKAINEWGEKDGKGKLFIEFDLPLEVSEMDDNEITITTNQKGEEKFGYLNLVIPFDTTDKISIIESVIKKMNKLKTFIESCK